MSLVDEFKKVVEGRKRNPIHNFGDKRAAPFKKKNKSAKNEALDCKYLSDGNCTIGCESESVELEAACPFVEDSIFANCGCFSDVVEESRKIKESYSVEPEDYKGINDTLLEIHKTQYKDLLNTTISAFKKAGTDSSRYILNLLMDDNGFMYAKVWPEITDYDKYEDFWHGGDEFCFGTIPQLMDEQVRVYVNASRQLGPEYEEIVNDVIISHFGRYSQEDIEKIKESHIISESVEVKLGDVFKLDDDKYHLVVDNDPTSFRTVSFNSDSEGYRYIGSIVSELDLDTSVVSLWTDPVDFADKIIQYIDNFYEFDVEDLSAEVAVVTMADQESPEYFESDEYDDEDDDSGYDDEDDGSVDVTYINNENYLGKFGSCHLFLKKTKS